MDRRTFLKVTATGFLALLSKSRMGTARTLKPGFQTIPIDWIRVDPRMNPRKIDEGYAWDLKESIRRNGLIIPIYVTENLILLDGYQRYKCLVQAGITQVLVFVPKDYSENLNEESNNRHRQRSGRSSIDRDADAAPRSSD